MTRKTFEATIVLEGSACFIPVTFDPKVVFGKVRAPVLVTLNGYTYRSTIASMGGQVCIPLRKSNREAAGLKGGETLRVTLELDAEKRTVDVPPDLDNALTPLRGPAGISSATRTSENTSRRSPKPKSLRRAHAGSSRPSPVSIDHRQTRAFSLALAAA